MKKINEWKDLSDAVKTILECVDINRKGVTLKVGEEFHIPYFSGVITEDIVLEIKLYEQSFDNNGFFKTISNGDTIEIVFLKGALK